MKVRDKKDTGQNALKKVSILDNLSLNTSYNFFADSFKLSPITLAATSNLFNKINITASGQLDPYDVNGQGQRVDRLLWQRKALSLGRLVSGNVSLSTSLRGGDKSKDTKAKVSPTAEAEALGMSEDQYNSDLAYINNNPGEYADFSIPWSVNLSYALSFSKVFIINRGFSSTTSQNANFGGTLAITKKLQMSLNGFYNITQGQLNQVSMTLSRDLHCWQMSISVSQSSLNRFFSINIMPKSALLRDLKINRTRSYYNGL
jgi:outer membrane usher protein FimD/PapC